ncbi:hypothetical protein D3C87_1580080 [compost metagenome]
MAVQLPTVLGARWLSISQQEIFSTSRSPLVTLYASLLIGCWVAHWPKFKEREPTQLVGLISSRSFGIYLLHPYVNQALSVALVFRHAPVLLRTSLVLTVSLVLVCLIGSLPGGIWLVGKPSPTGIAPRRERVPA